ncbi:protein MODIFYING WALL LIGNIN-1-like isoform X2 [Arachis duranensis]|uniref:Protein MODIFYING WALL LIGNIN-1 isoform X3 n=1 Tax=Arachis duranensis TaxID=130453 RepID=A0A6P4CFL6_ARADU|nr:protein MODIFYING WALL LIGNIN-1 isoform X3 [Arachis duranensis]XP_052112035.1 protein MODIFYING WALL LIGNIN-1-like isoform X2 [Arachis duranensis]
MFLFLEYLILPFVPSLFPFLKSLHTNNFVLAINNLFNHGNSFSKEDDLRWNGKLCYLPTSPSFGLGIAALVTLFIAHIIGNTMMFKSSCSSKIPALAKILWFISWLSFGIAVILLIAATSMSRRQVYGMGWLNGECYLVKGGTYAGSAILVLLTIGSINASAFSTSQFHLTNKIHKQMG